MPVHPDLLLMLLADARLPVAGHTQSGTLEGALLGGLDPAAVPTYVLSRLASVTLVEAGTAVVARHRCTQPRTRLAEVEWAWTARTASPALRAASRAQGRALLRLADRLWPESDALAEVSRMDAPSRAVVLGCVAAASGLPPRSLARLVAYDDVQTVCAAALKLVPLDPAEVARWVHQALGAVEAVAEATAHLTDAAAIPATGAPQIEAWAQAHAAAPRRLFRA